MRAQAEITGKKLGHINRVAVRGGPDAGAAVVRKGQVFLVWRAGQPAIDKALRKDIDIDARLRREMLGRDIFSDETLELGVRFHEHGGGDVGIAAAIDERILERHLDAAFAGNRSQFGIENQRFRRRVEFVALILDQAVDAGFQRRHLLGRIRPVRAE